MVFQLLSDLLDPPLHEFLPKSKKEISEVAKVIKVDVKDIKSKN